MERERERKRGSAQTPEPFVARNETLEGRWGGGGVEVVEEKGRGLVQRRGMGNCNEQPDSYK